MDVGFLLDQRLGSIAMMYIPVHDENSLQAVVPAGVMRGNRDIAEQAETHRACADRMVAGRPDRGEVSRVNSGDGEVHPHQYAASPGSRGIPRSRTDYRVGIEPAAASVHDLPDSRDVSRVVGELQLVNGRVSSLEVIDGMKYLRVLAQGARDRAQAADVLGMSPPGVVPSAIAVRDECGPHGPSGVR